MTRQKSLLLTYIRRKQRSAAAAALFTTAVFLLLVAMLTAPALMGVPSAQPTLSGYGRASYPSTGLATEQSAVFVAMWVLSLVILVPVELALRKL